MSSTFIHRFCAGSRNLRALSSKVLAGPRFTWGHLAHLFDMNTERLAGLGLEPMLTTSELAEYLGVHVQAIYDLRADGRGPTGIRVGRELRYRISDVRSWLDRLHEPEPSLAVSGGGH
ncbi:helix-turn-helix transcriptional regulator [Microbacterium atlanticum]|uniref:helix-turn-helix transcriptional regulator n=1 Tax=Microbacterium atlanticum TaxID=2782168 RepID=UPI001E50628C|nr:helix-turn-helix domain-containing protein [Microbacterium atlanticum]